MNLINTFLLQREKLPSGVEDYRAAKIEGHCTEGNRLLWRNALEVSSANRSSPGDQVLPREGTSHLER
jgi:hypothetical protein